MQNYPYFLSQLTTIVYIPIFAVICLILRKGWCGVQKSWVDAVAPGWGDFFSRFLSQLIVCHSATQPGAELQMTWSVSPKSASSGWDSWTPLLE